MKVDEILAAIDTGLQTAGDMAYGDDWPDTCWRCGEPATDLCDKCRTALLDEATAGDIIDGLITLNVDQFIEHLDALIAGFADLPLDLRRAIAQGVLDDLPTIDITNQGATSECSTSPQRI